MQSLPSHDPTDPDFRRLRYVRYADDFLLGFAGPYHEAVEIKHKLGVFSSRLGLTLSEEKTLITNATTGAQNSWGMTSVWDAKTATKSNTGGRINGMPSFEVPPEVVHSGRLGMLGTARSCIARNSQLF